MGLSSTLMGALPCTMRSSIWCNVSVLSVGVHVRIIIILPSKPMSKVNHGSPFSLERHYGCFTLKIHLAGNEFHPYTTGTYCSFLFYVLLWYQYFDYRCTSVAHAAHDLEKKRIQYRDCKVMAEINPTVGRLLHFSLPHLSRSRERLCTSLKKGTSLYFVGAA